MVFSIDPNVKGAISESFDKSHLSESFDVPAGCISFILVIYACQKIEVLGMRAIRINQQISKRKFIYLHSPID